MPQAEATENRYNETDKGIATIIPKIIPHTSYTALRQLSLLSTSLALLQRSKSALLLRLLNLFNNGILKGLGLGKGSPAVNNLAIRGDKELLKVPLDALHAHDPRLLLLQESPYRCSVSAVHV